MIYNAVFFVTDERPSLPEGRSLPEGFDFTDRANAIDLEVSVTVLC